MVVHGWLPPGFEGDPVLEVSVDDADPVRLIVPEHRFRATIPLDGDDGQGVSVGIKSEMLAPAELRSSEGRLLSWVLTGVVLEPRDACEVMPLEGISRS
jgi:hypothetical protein